MAECKQYKQEIATLYDELGEYQQTESDLSNEIIKLKFESDNITQSYTALRTRLANL